MGALRRSVAAVAALTLASMSAGCAGPASPSPSLDPLPTATASPASTRNVTPPTAMPTPSPATSIAFEPLDPAAFALEPGAPDGVDGLRAWAVTPKDFGWLAGGGYSSSGDGRPPTDAAAWISSDGRDWERMAAPERACDGYHWISEFIGGPLLWAVGGCSVFGSDGAMERTVPVLWRLKDQVTWERIDTRCIDGVRCGNAGVAVVQALRLAELDDAMGTGWLLGAGFAGSRFSALRMELDGTVSAATRLALPAWAEDEAATIAASISGNPEVGWVITARTPILGEEGPQPMPVAWSSRDGLTWSLLDERAITSLWNGNVGQIDWTPDGWFALGEQLLQSTDLASWSQVTAPAGVGWWYGIAAHRDMLFAFVDDVQLVQSDDGLAWTIVPVPAGDHLSAGGSDYESFILVGSHGPDAAAWGLVMPE